MKMRIIYLLILLCSFAIAGCGASGNYSANSPVIRQAENTPDAFLPPEGGSFDGDSCKSPLIDGRDGTRIVMVAATNGEGIYAVPPQKYGVKEGELLKVDCKTGKPIGIVKGR